MLSAIDQFLARSGRVGTRAELVRVVGRTALDNEVRRGRLAAIFPRTYVRPWDVGQRDVELRAALATVGGECALSHVTALEHWNLPTDEGAPIHVTAYNPRHPRGVAGRLIVHRTLLPLGALHHDGLPVVRPELAVVTSWPLIAGDDQRAPLIEASRRRLLLPPAVLDLAERMWWVRDIRRCRELVAMIAAGCESELELWGYTDVFTVPGLDDASRQVVLRSGGKTYRLDMAFEEERLAVELDGRKYHASTEQWERDIARDLALAKLGWQTIRLSHDRLRGDVHGCRRDVLDVRAARRRRVS